MNRTTPPFLPLSEPIIRFSQLHKIPARYLNLSPCRPSPLLTEPLRKTLESGVLFWQLVDRHSSPSPSQRRSASRRRDTTEKGLVDFPRFSGLKRKCNQAHFRSKHALSGREVVRHAQKARETWKLLTQRPKILGKIRGNLPSPVKQ